MPKLNTKAGDRQKDNRQMVSYLVEFEYIRILFINK